MRVVLMLGGGGALGAFDCGVLASLAPRLEALGASLVAVGGVSVGALNAALVARAGPSLAAGADALDTAWRDALATPSLPFAGVDVDAWWPAGTAAALGLPDARLRSSWNGLLTGLLAGNRQLHRANPLRWNPVAGLDRARLPLHDRDGMRRWLEARVGDVRSDDDAPALCVAATDVLRGEPVVFDSVGEAVTPAHLCASAALPLLFEPVTLAGRLLWDGDVARASALPAMLRRLRDVGRLGPRAGGERTLLVTVDHMSRTLPHAPCSDVELLQRAMELLLHGKMQADTDDLDGIDAVLHVERDAMAHDAVSGQFDYSPERIDELIARGRAQADAAWRAADLGGLVPDAHSTLPDLERPRAVH